MNLPEPTLLKPFKLASLQINTALLAICSLTTARDAIRRPLPFAIAISRWV